MSRINEQHLSHWIDNFYGYGSWDSKVWLIALDETGGEVPEEVAEKIDYFQSTHPVNTNGTLCDVREVYRHISMKTDSARTDSFTNRYEYRFGDRAVLHGVWKNLIAFVHGYQDKTIADPLEYQKRSFAALSDANEALISFYPLPGPHSHSWYYSWLDVPSLPFLKSRQLYEDHMYEQRMNAILDNISKYKPELVLMYGMNNILNLKKSVQQFFDGVQFKMVKAIKMEIPQHHSANVNGTRLLITTQIPALHHQRPETGFNWKAFGRSL